MITGNQGLVKQLNKWLVLNTIRQSHRISRADVARETGLNSATVSNLTTELLSHGLIQEWGSAVSRLGRRPVMLGVNPSGLFAVGVELQARGIRLVVTNLVADIIVRAEAPLREGAEPGAVAAAIADSVTQALTHINIPPAKLAGVGIAVTGLVDPQTGVVLQSANLHWHQVPLKALIQKHLALPVLVERDALAGAMSELWYGAGRSHHDLVFFLIDTGIGAGIVIDRQIRRGAHGGAGEVGHMAIDSHGPRCNCGNDGCLEACASGPDASRYLGLALANIINLYDPDVVILGGAIPLADPALCETMIAAATSRALPILACDVSITLPHFGPDACAVGAATLVLERSFEPVQVVAAGK